MFLYFEGETFSSGINKQTRVSEILEIQIRPRAIWSSATFLNDTPYS